MVEKLPSLPSELSERPRYAAQVTDDLLIGGRRLRQAFLQTPMRFAGRDMPLIRRMTYNLPLTQEQIADHLGLTLVHVNRTLRRLREERIVLVDRQVVIIMNLERLREFAQGLPQPAELPDPVVSNERMLEEQRGAEP